MNLLQTFEQEQLTKLSKDKVIPDFQAGDTVKVMVKVTEGTRERTQAYEGVCIARKNAGLNSSFTVRKISYGEGVERVFPLYSPNIEILLLRRGIVRRAKLYYLRGLTGKKARIAEKITRKTGAQLLAPQEQEPIIPAEPIVEEVKAEPVE
jgi:large subunit ribosomal protein L19